jgi:phage tail sheath protein FI
MATYQTPGVYVEETSYRDQTIAGAGTRTAAFIGPTRFGPWHGRPELLTSFADFTRIYGDLGQLALPTTDKSLVHNYLAQGVRAFFNEGGSQCYVMRLQTGGTAAAATVGGLTLNARYEGAYGNNLQVTITLALGQNLLRNGALNPGAVLQTYDTVVGVKKDGSADQLMVTAVTPAGPTVTMSDGKTAPTYANYTQVSTVTATVTVVVLGTDKKPASSTAWSGLGLAVTHPNSIAAQFAANPPDRATQLYVPLVLAATPDPATALFAVKYDGTNTALAKFPSPSTPVVQSNLTGGTDGNRPTSTDYQGADSTSASVGKTGLVALQDLDDISILAAPGASLIGKTVDSTKAAWTRDDVIATNMALIQHCQTMRYRVAVLDSPEQQLVSDVLDFRSQMADPSGYGALYYPWVRIKDPVTSMEINLPPSGFVAGIYARSDNTYDVSKAPANEPIQSAIGLEVMINKAQQESLNPNGVNCIRFFPNRGYLVWGARTLSTDSDWIYVNVRRYMCYLEHSLDNSTQWTVFQNNGPELWKQLTSSITDFLYNEWAEGRLLGDTAAQSFFVRCDRTTMTQFDLDSGRLIAEIGVSVLKPAEFVIFRIGQWVATGS